MAKTPPDKLSLTVPMRDGIRLAIDVYLPGGNRAYPALLALSAYGKKAMIPGIALSTDIPPTIEHGHTDRLVGHGYAHVVGDVRGSGDSEGHYTLWGRKEQEDCYDLIEWVAQQPWCDGNAIDYLYAEWNSKAAGFVSYGAADGARAAEHRLRGSASMREGGQPWPA